MTYPIPKDMHTNALEEAIYMYIEPEALAGLSDDDAKRLGELLIEWSKR